MNNDNSMLYWYPKLKGAQVMTPRTEIVELQKRDRLMEICDGNFDAIEGEWPKILEASRKIR